MSYKTHSTYRPPPPDGSPTLRPGIERDLAALACADGRHRTETNPDTGDEVCRSCKEVITS